VEAMRQAIDFLRRRRLYEKNALFADGLIFVVRPRVEAHDTG
jgi:hypothetical protein